MLGVLFSGPPSFLQKGSDGEGFGMAGGLHLCESVGRGPRAEVSVQALSSDSSQRAGFAFDHQGYFTVQIVSLLGHKFPSIQA